MMQVNRVIELDEVPADIFQKAGQGLVIRGAEDSFPSVTRANVDGVVLPSLKCSTSSLR